MPTPMAWRLLIMATLVLASTLVLAGVVCALTTALGWLL